MALVVKDERKKFNPAPEGLLGAVCCDAYALGLQDTP